MRGKGKWARETRRVLWHLRHKGIRHTWRKVRSRYLLRGWSAASVRKGPGGSLEFTPWPEQTRPPKTDVRVGVILDDFSRLAFAYEWEQVLLKPSSWRSVLEREPIDLLFAESAWAGNGGAWRYHMTGPTAPRSEFVELVGWCRDQGIPTVFWNKEDPAHFEDFIDAAELFNWVFTTDSARLSDYRERLGHGNVDVLTFGAAPAIHNPIRPNGFSPTRDVCFAGMYFAHKYPERREQMDLLLNAALRASEKMELGLEIFSRELGGESKYGFPAPYDARVVGSLPYAKMLTAYREYKVFLNVNSVVSSPTMCARRVFEISASGTPVVSTPSEAIVETFPSDEVFVVDDAETAEHTIRALVRSPELRDRATHRAQRRIWADHTYSHRVHTVLSAVGLEEQAQKLVARPSVSALVSTNRPHQLRHVLETFASQRACDKQLVLLAHGFTADWTSLRSYAQELGIDNFVTLEAGTDLTLGECLNKLVNSAEGEVVTKMDDDDLYGPNYLSDQLNALNYSNADVVGKQAHYMHLESTNATLLRFAEREHRFTDFIMGPTIMAYRDVMVNHPFKPVNRGEDTRLLSDIAASNCSIYSSDRFNFAQIRADNAKAHTWGVAEAEILSSGTVHFYGAPQQHIFI